MFTSILFYYLIISVAIFLGFNTRFVIDTFNPRDSLRLAIIQSYEQGWKSLLALFFLIFFVLVVFSFLWPLLALALLINIFKPSFLENLIEKVMDKIEWLLDFVLRFNKEGV